MPHHQIVVQLVPHLECETDFPEERKWAGQPG